MPLRNLFYLSDSALNSAGGASATQARWLKPLWVLPRAWCVMASLQAKGVPRHKTTAFVRLHLARLAPFVDSGVYACRAGDWVHFWFWENQRVRDFCLNHKLDFATINLAPESVCLPKIRDGAVLYRCIEGVEAQLWYKGALQDSAWWPKQIDNQDWQAWLSTGAASGSSRAMPVAWPEAMPQVALATGKLGQRTSENLLKPWAANILGEKWWRGFQGMRSGLFFILSGAVFLGFSGYLLAQWWFVQWAQQRVDQEIALLSVRVDPVLAARSKAQAQQQWTSKIAKLNQQIGLNDILSALAPALLQQEVALREFEFGEGELRLILVPVNSELNVTAIIQQLETLPKLTNIRLLPESDTRILRISAQIKPLSSAIALPASQTNGLTVNNSATEDKAKTERKERAR